MRWLKFELGRHYIAAIFFGLLMSVSMGALAATKEQAVKTGFIYNFTKFVVWPNSSYVLDTFNLCIVGGNDLGNSLQALDGKLVGNKPLALRRMSENDSLRHCHVVFLNKENSIQKTIQKINHLPILTVSDSVDFINQGGMIGLIRDGRRVGFEINIQAVNAAGLHIGAQLLKLAKKVKGLQ